MSYTSEQIRNIAVVGSGGSGKTSLVDLLLFKAGATTRPGRVDDGTSLSDHTPEEKDVKHSLYLSLLSLEHAGRHVHLIDTPGYPDFVGEAYAAMAAVDSVLLMIDASGTINANARRLYRFAREHGLPTFVVINRLDHDQANLERTEESIRALLGTECTRVFHADAVGGTLSSVKSFLDPANADLPGRSNLVESLVETDEAVMEKYLEEGSVDEATITSLYRNAVAAAAMVPVLCTSVLKDVGVDELLAHLVEFAPSPVTAPGRKGEQGGKEVRVSAAIASPCAQVFKSLTDPYVGKLSFLRVWSGEIAADSGLHLVRTGKVEKIPGLLKVQGKETSALPRAIAGDLVAIAKTENLETGDTLVKDQEIALARVEAPRGMVSVAIEPISHNDEQKLSTGIRKLVGEDLALRAERDPVTAELVVTGLTNLHIDTALKRLKDRFGVEVSTKLPRVPLRETVAGRAEGHHRHKKQTGGAGQFGEVFLKIEPAARGAGFEFSDEVVGGSIPRNFIPAVEKGVVASLSEGVYAGYPVVDVIVRVYDGKHHPVDSNENSFRTAGGRAFRDAFLKARPVLLEPIVKITIEVPASAMGDITGDLNSRRGRIQGMDSVGNLQIIHALIPLREIQTYSTELRSMTGGEGSYTYELTDYDIVPTSLAKEIAEDYQKGRKEEASA